MDSRPVRNLMMLVGYESITELPTILLPVPPFKTKITSFFSNNSPLVGMEQNDKEDSPEMDKVVVVYQGECIQKVNYCLNIVAPEQILKLVLSSTWRDDIDIFITRWLTETKPKLLLKDQPTFQSERVDSANIESDEITHIQLVSGGFFKSNVCEGMVDIDSKLYLGEKNTDVTVEYDGERWLFTKGNHNRWWVAFTGNEVVIAAVENTWKFSFNSYKDWQGYCYLKPGETEMHIARRRRVRSP